MLWRRKTGGTWPICRNTMTTRRINILTYALLAVTLSGCGGAKLAPVSGTVTLDGKPVDGVRVIFEPIVGESDVTDAEYHTSFGITNEQGQFAMQTQMGDTLKPGAVIGNSSVRFVCIKRANFMNKGLADSRAVHDLPALARDKTMRFTIKASGSTAANFDLKKD